VLHPDRDVPDRLGLLPHPIGVRRLALEEARLHCNDAERITEIMGDDAQNLVSRSEGPFRRAHRVSFATVHLREPLASPPGKQRAAEQRQRESG
jgi:hypothetical protein